MMSLVRPTLGLKPRHLIIVAVLSLAFTAAFVIRLQPLEYGFELHEFDPFFNYRATQYLVDNGLDAYYSWDDSLSWYPDGRNVSATSQVILHQTAAAAYWVFGSGSSLYDFTIMFPAVFGALSVIVLFALVRVIGGTTAGLVSSMLMAVSLPIIIRGTAGWFKSEPLGIFYGLLGVYLFLSGLKSQNRPVAAAKLVSGAIFTSFSLSAWGGSQFFVIPIGILMLCLPFLRPGDRSLVWAMPLFTVSLLGSSLMFENPGTSFVLGLGGVTVLGPTIFLVACHFVHRASQPDRAKRNCAILLVAILVGGSGAVFLATEVDILGIPTFRYLNAVNPFLVAVDPLVDSVSEHQSVSIDQSFLFHSVLLIFGGIGAWLILDPRVIETGRINREMIVFALATGMLGVYLSSAFIRLEVFGSIAVIMLSSLGISVLVRHLAVSISRSTFPAHVVMVGGITVLLLAPVITPGESVIEVTRGPPSILSGASAYGVITNDWKDTYEWIKNNTPPDAVVASWWDYGYWTQTLGERASVADNFTVSTTRIQEVATMMLSPPDEAYARLLDLQADYFMIFVMAERLQTDGGEPVYILGGGGDESKKHWFIRIAGEPLSKYTLSDGMSGTDYFWDNTMLGMMMPFTPIIYVEPAGGMQFTEYVEGTIPIYVKDIKYPADGDGPLRLVYASNSFQDELSRVVFGIFVYEVNQEYSP